MCDTTLSMWYSANRISVDGVPDVILQLDAAELMLLVVILWLFWRLEFVCSISIYSSMGAWAPLTGTYASVFSSAKLDAWLCDPEPPPAKILYKRNQKKKRRRAQLISIKLKVCGVTSTSNVRDNSQFVILRFLKDHVLQYPNVKSILSKFCTEITYIMLVFGCVIFFNVLSKINCRRHHHITTIGANMISTRRTAAWAVHRTGATMARILYRHAADAICGIRLNGQRERRAAAYTATRLYWSSWRSRCIYRWCNRIFGTAASIDVRPKIIILFRYHGAWCSRALRYGK